MKQTAVEWLEEQMKTWGDLPRWKRDEIIQQAKEMEKEQKGYSEEEVLELLIKCPHGYSDVRVEWFEKFKKK